jgi:hypothetical protein
MKKITTQKQLDKITVIKKDTIIEGDLKLPRNIELINCKIELRNSVSCSNFWFVLNGKNMADVVTWDDSKADVHTYDKSKADVRTHDKSTAYLNDVRI